MRFFFILTIMPFFLFSQNKKMICYDTENKIITLNEFSAKINHKENLDLKFKNDTIIILKLINRKIKGKLNAEQLQSLKNYFQKENSIPIEQDDYIVINYVTSYPIIENEIIKSRWSILQKGYIRKLHKKIKCKQFWIHDIIQENLEPYNYRHIKWLKEKDEFIKNMFYEYVANYGNVTIVKPDGQYYTYLGEYGPEKVYKGITELK